MISNVIDRPVSADEDSLNMSAYAAALTEFIANAQSPLTIALQGEWGSGKTSLMNALKKSLVDENDAPYFGVWINTWQYALMSDPEEAIRNILLGIIGQVSDIAKSTMAERISLFKKLARMGGGFASDVFKKYSGIDLEKAVKEWCVGDDAPSKSGVEDLKDELARLVRNALVKEETKRGFLFFIDDLDRIDPPVAVQMLELFKNIFDLENCIFVLAIDYGVVVKGLKPKFGEKTAANEREFRSFFDKIIQLPFSMPVGSYQIDKFLMSSLVKIGYLEAADENDKTLCETLTFFAIHSVGTNPRSLKRLINYLSLIRLLIGKTETDEDDADLAKWKDILFALVSLQIQYPKVYDALHAEPEFPAWGEKFEQKWRLPALEQGEKEKLGKMEEFDEPWEQMLFRFCRRDTFLEASALNISLILNKIRTRITDTRQPIGDTVEWLLRLSAVTNVKSEAEQQPIVVNFHRGNYLKDLRWWTLRLRNNNGTGVPWCTVLHDDAVLTSYQVRVQSNLQCQFRKGTLAGINPHETDYINDNYLGDFSFTIYHDRKSFRLKAWGSFWGNTHKQHYHIDFNADSIQSDLKKAEKSIRDAWQDFGISADCCGHSPNGIWWNISIPFKDLNELVSEDFSNKLRGSLAKVAAAFATLTPYRIPTTTK